MAMSPCLCRQISLFHRHSRDFVCNHGDRGLKFAQQCRHRKSFWIWTKEAQKARKSPKTARFCSALPCIVTCVAAQCRHAYSCNKIRQSPNSIISFQIAVFCVLGFGWRTWSPSFFNRHTGLSLGLHEDIYGRKEEGCISHLPALVFTLNYDYHLATAPINSFVFVRLSAFTTPIL